MRNSNVEMLGPGPYAPPGAGSMAGYKESTSQRWLGRIGALLREANEYGWIGAVLSSTTAVGSGLASFFIPQLFEVTKIAIWLDVGSITLSGVSHELSSVIARRLGDVYEGTTMREGLRYTFNATAEVSSWLGVAGIFATLVSGVSAAAHIIDPQLLWKSAGMTASSVVTYLATTGPARKLDSTLRREPPPKESEVSL